MAEKRRIVIFGTGKGADMATRLFHSDTGHDIAGYIVDREFYATSSFMGRPVAVAEDAPATFSTREFVAFVPMGATRMNALRAEKYEALKALGYRFASFIHSSNRFNDGVVVGENCFILENQSINLDARIGNNVVLWSGCQIGDRSVIEDHVFMASHVAFAGDSIAGARSYFGSNSTVANGVKVGRRCFVGANALIGADTEDDAVHVIEPTKAIGITSTRFEKMLRTKI